MNISLQNNQSLLDIAIACYGDVQGVYWLVADNGFSSILDNVAPGDILFIRDNELMNAEIVKRAKRQLPATLEDSKAEGIGFWDIGNDFKVV